MSSHGLHIMHHLHHPETSGFVKLIPQFFIGGTIVAVVSWVVSHTSTKIAALIYSLPITMIPILFFVLKHARANDDARILQHYTGQTFAGILLLALFCAALYWFVAAQTDQNDTSKVMSAGTLWSIIAISLLFMAVPMLWFYYWVCDGVSSAPCYFG